MHDPRKIAEYIFAAALRAVDPHESVRRNAGLVRNIYDKGFERLIALGFGKAAAPMALAVEEELGDLLDAGVIITKYGHACAQKPDGFRIFEAGHPIPDENGILGTEEILRLAGTADTRTLVVVLISGGGSALLVAPDKGISLNSKQLTTNLLLRCGADIHELNTVRKHLSAVKGGRLAATIHPGSTLSLILSDVIGDNLDVIASGPTSPDPTTFRDAVAVLERYDLLDRVPPEVAEHLAAGVRGFAKETPKQGNEIFSRVENRIIGNNRAALEAARDFAATCCVEAEILPGTVTGEAREEAKRLARIAQERRASGRKPPFCLVSGGETTVTVRGRGKGGRNQELALSFAMEISGTPGITLLSAGTDGADGPTDAAGAVVNGESVRNVDMEKARAYLDNNDSYSYFLQRDGLFVTGPTGTNVADIQIMIIS